VLSGKPTTPGTYNFDVFLLDKDGNGTGGEFQLTVT
jgi:hypothetical protein